MSQTLRTILCTDDEPDVLLIARMCLETVGGYHVVTATSGDDAIRSALQATPDLILLDVMMPNKDGPTTLRELRQHPELAGIPVIFVTARIREHEINEYLALGANGVVAKPFDPMQLSAQVQRLWEEFHAGH